MPRYIDADKLCEGRVSNDSVVIAAKCEPTADAVPVIHAHRILENNGSAVCSNCYRLDEIDLLANFCHYCDVEFEEG